MRYGRTKFSQNSHKTSLNDKSAISENSTIKQELTEEQR